MVTKATNHNIDSFNSTRGSLILPNPPEKDAGNGGRRWVCVVAGGEGLVAAADEGGGEWLGSGWWWCAALLPGGGRSGVGCRDSSSRLLLL
ncbi:hypothetical protein Dimus_005894 [Dionaea muscipula]